MFSLRRDLYLPAGAQKICMNRSILIISTILIPTLAVSAHDTWLLPRAAFVLPGKNVQLDLTSGMSFPHLDTSIKPERIEVARFRLNGQTGQMEKPTSAPKSLLLRASLKDAGIATCWVALKPRQLELTPDQVEEYFQEIDATSETRQAWQNMKPPKRWREVYVKQAKTFIQVGQNQNDKSWSEPVGMSLEIVPDKDPTTMQAGDDFPVRVLKGGAAFSNFPVGIVFEGSSHGEFRTTDSAGRVVFTLPRSGRYLLRGTDLRPSIKPDLEWESDFTTLTIQVGSKRIKP